MSATATAALPTPMQPPTLTLALSSDYARTTGGWVYNQRIVRELEVLGWRVHRLQLPPGFPNPTPAAIAQTDALLAALPDGGLVLADQICMTPIPTMACRHAERVRLVVIAHHPMAEEHAEDSVERVRIARDEARVLAAATAVIVTSQQTSDTLRRDYAIGDARMVVAPPGTDPAPVSPGSGHGPPHILSVGAIIPRKAPLALLRALAACADLPWRLTLVGDVTRSPDTVAAVRAACAEPGLAGRVDLPGAVSAAALESAWRSADLFVSASRHEGYGMAIAEALARGIAVVTTAAGAVEGWIDRRAAIVVPADDDAGLAEALRTVLCDAAVRGRLRAGALEARAALPSWRDAAARIDRALRACLEN